MALVCDFFSCVLSLSHVVSSVLGQLWYLIVSIPNLCIVPNCHTLTGHLLCHISQQMYVLGVSKVPPERDKSFEHPTQNIKVDGYENIHNFTPIFS